MKYDLKDSGKREQFSTGSKRDIRLGKGRFDLLPPEALTLLAIHFEKGGSKYGFRNWERGQPISRYMDSTLRHLCKYLAGELDEDHLVAAGWNVLAAITTRERCLKKKLPKFLNDIPPKI